MAEDGMLMESRELGLANITTLRHDDSIVS